MNKIPLNLDLDEAFSVAITGIIRASIFSGIILSDKNIIDVKSWHINEAFKICNNEFNVQTKDEALSEFKKWVIKNSLREMMEYFDYSLSLIYEKLYIINKYNEVTNLILIKKAVDEFNRSKNGFPEKIDKVNKLLDTSLNDSEDYWKALQKIRNVITHNMGVIDKKTIIIKVPYVETIIKTAEGHKVCFKPGDIIDTNKYPIAEMSIKIGYKTKIYKKGEIVNFDSEDIMYIIWGMQQAMGHLKDIIIKKTLQMNIPIVDKNSNKIIENIEEFNNNMNLLNIKIRESDNAKELSL